MKAEELRIGNLVHYNGIHKETGTVTGIMTYATGHQNISINYRKDISYSINELQPIELTEEWLFKFGYDLITESHFAIPGHLIWKCNDLLMCDKNGVILRHVHQLQNLYFALTNQELTLTK